MNTTKHNEEKEESRVEPEWFKTDLGTIMKRQNFEKLGNLMNEATVALKEFQDELKKAHR